MIEFTKFMTHKDKPGVRAKMHYQECVDRHLAGGWVLERKVIKRKRQSKKVK